MNKLQTILSFNCRNKKSYYDWWTKVFDQPVINNLRTYDSIGKIATGQGDDYTTGCLLDNNYFKNYYEI